MISITLTTPCFEPLAKPHFKKRKVGFAEVYIIFLIFDRKYRLWVLVGLVEAVLTSPHNLYLNRDKENIIIFHPKNAIFRAMKEGYILHGFVNVISTLTYQHKM